jgi:putative ABC transport system permease protein
VHLLAMIKNYFKIALRTLWKNKGYAAINVFGLSVAFCICVFLFLTAYRQLTFDSFHEDGDRIFQTYTFYNDPAHPERSGSMPIPLAPALKEEYPEVEAAARFLTGRTSLVTYQDKYFDKLIGKTDADFLTMFSFPLLKGSREAALSNLSSIVLSKSMAEAVFGQVDPIGKQIQVGSAADQRTYLVSAVMDDMPDNSSIKCDALVRIESMPDYQSRKSNWYDFSHPVFIKLTPQADPKALEARLRPFAAKYFPESFENLKRQKATPDERGDLFAIRLQKLSDVHFDREISGGKGAPIAVVYAIIGIGVFILVIASINFINLSVARSFTRLREMGVRKSLGAVKSQLFVQIWGESLLVCVVAFLTGCLLAWQLVPAFNATFDARIALPTLFEPGFVAVMVGIFLLVSLIAGGYPAWKSARFNPVEVLKGKITAEKPGAVRNSLIVTQFALSILLICCTVIAVQQIGHLRQQPLGFQKEQVVSIPVGNRTNGRQVLQRMRNRFASDPDIVSITGSGVNLGKGKDKVTSRSIFGFTYKEKQVNTDWLLVDYDYLKTLNIKLLGGREFDPSYAADSTNRVIITESMARAIGNPDPVGSYFETDTSGTRYQIIGLVPDFQLYSVAQEQKPITMHLSGSEAINYIFIRVAPTHLNGTLDKLKKVWREVAPTSEFMGSFLDENVNDWYQNEEMMTRMFSLAATITILLSCMGLFALALLVIEQRTKEIGIRKVMGASLTNVVFLLSRDFVKLVLIALLIAIPLAWFGMQQWLNQYAYRIEINALVFAGVGIVAVLIALATVSYQSLRAALMNPVKSLRSE